MRTLLSGSVTKFSHNDMDLYLEQVPAGISKPYCIFYLINAVPDETETFNAAAEDIEIQFSIFSTTGFEVMGLADDLHALFDNCQLTVSGYDFIQMKRQFFKIFKDGDSYQAVTTYSILIEK